MRIYESAKRLAGELNAIALTIPDHAPARRTLRDSADLLESMVRAEIMYEASHAPWTEQEVKRVLDTLTRIDKRLVKVAPMRPQPPRREIADKTIPTLDEFACTSIDEVRETMDGMHGRDQDGIEMGEME